MTFLALGCLIGMGIVGLIKVIKWVVKKGGSLMIDLGFFVLCLVLPAAISFNYYYKSQNEVLIMDNGCNMELGLIEESENLESQNDKLEEMLEGIQFGDEDYKSQKIEKVQDNISTIASDIEELNRKIKKMEVEYKDIIEEKEESDRLLIVTGVFIPLIIAFKEQILNLPNQITGRFNARKKNRS